jgi:hypothetical protein
VEAEVIPIGLYFGRLRPGESIERAVLIRPAEGQRFRIQEVKSEHALVVVGPPEPAPAPERPGSYRLLVRIGPSDREVSVNSRIVVRTDLPHDKEVIIPVFGRVVDPDKPRVTPPTS